MSAQNFYHPADGSGVPASSAVPILRRKAAEWAKRPIATLISPDHSRPRHSHVREVPCIGRRTVPLDSNLPITNDGGGHTSAKVGQADLLTDERTRVLSKTGSSGDVGSMKLDGFASLYVNKLLTRGKLYRDHALADEMAGALPHCTLNSNARGASIDTPPHALLAVAHVGPINPERAPFSPHGHEFQYGPIISVASCTDATVVIAKPEACMTTTIRTIFMAQIEAKLLALGLTLPPPLQPPPGTVLPFRFVRILGNRVLISGHGPQNPDGSFAKPFGKLGREVSLEQGYLAARLVALSILASLKRELGDLDRVAAWSRVFGMVNSAPGFNQQPNVINGFSDLILELYGPDAGAHSRSAVGLAELPFNIPVEIEGEVELMPNQGLQER